MKTSKPVVIFGAMMLVALQISTIWEIFEKAKIQDWRHFWIDLGFFYAFALATGAIITEAILYRKYKRP